MEGYRTKSSVLRMVEENSAQQALIAQMQQQIEQLTNQNTGMQAVIGEYKNMLATPAQLEAKQQEADYNPMLQATKDAGNG